MNTHVIYRTKTMVISVIALIVVFGLLFAWRTIHNLAPPQTAMLLMLVSAIRAQTRNVASELQAIGGLQAMC